MIEFQSERKKKEEMKTANPMIGWIVGLIVLIGGYGAAFAQGPPQTPAQEQIEVLTRGPVHEAFAEPVMVEVQPGLIVSNQPPPDIEEVPPAHRPRGDQFIWVPGYWSWDADRNDFIWVSACWRVGPPNMYWVPGYWAAAADVQEVRRGGVEVNVGGVHVRVGGEQVAPARTTRWQWVSGFWAPAGALEIEYLQAPPAPMDIEPLGPPPTADNMWVPGCWYWHQGQYVRRPGYWLRQQPDWVWVPSHYRWTRQGYVFCPGYWDRVLERRGVLFAPVYFSRSVYGRSGFTYSPSIAIDVGALRLNLFVYPSYSHYYFGDYYDDAYVRVGIYPLFERARKHTYYDPIYSHDRWRNQRTEPGWEDRQRREYDRRHNDRDLRPARTYREQETRLATMPEPQRRAQRVARPLAVVVTSPETQLKFEQIKPDARQKIAKQATGVHEFREKRKGWEAPAAVREQPKEAPPAARERRKEAPAAEYRPKAAEDRPKAEEDRPKKVKIPKPPIVGKPAESDKPELAPPPAPKEERQSETDSRGQGTKPGSDKNKGKGSDNNKEKGSSKNKGRGN